MPARVLSLNDAVLFGLTILALTLARLDAQESPKRLLSAGAATSNITPPLGAEIVGGFLPVPSTHVHDELHARCLVLNDGKTTIAFVVCDLLGLHRSVCLESRQRIEALTGIPGSHVMISATHTHSATSAIGETPRAFVSDRALSDYELFVARRIADGVRRAMNVRRPAEIAFGSIDLPEHVFNRRWFMKEGTVPVTPFGGTLDKVKMNPPAGSINLIEPAGPTDPAVSFIALREPMGRLISVFSAYSLHYVGGVGNGHISADYFGEFSETLKKLQPTGDVDPPFVAMMANGTSGDINNINFRTPRPAKKPYEQMKYVADDVASKVNAALTTVNWMSDISLDARYKELDLAWRKVDANLLNWAEQTEAKAVPGPPDIPTVYAGRIKRLAKPSPETRAPVQVLRIGQICIGTSPCETFAETGLEFKKRSPFPQSFMVELANGYYGYLPTPRHFELGGYETWPGTNYLEPEASVKIMDALLDLARDLATDVK